MGRIHSSRALYFASRAGAPAGKKSLRQRTGPLAIRPNVSVPDGTCEDPVFRAPSDFPASTSNELERLSMTAQPSLFNIQGPAEETVDQNPDFPLFSCEELGQPSTIASSNLPFFTLEQMLAKTEETMEQKLVRAETEEAVRARKSFNTPSMPTCWGPEQPFQASRQDFFGPPSQDIATPEKRTAEQMQVAAALRARGGSGVPFRARTGIPLAKVANPMAMPGSIPSAPLQGHPQAEKPKSRDFPTAHTNVKKIYAAALAAAGTNVVQFEEAMRIIYN